MNYQQFNKKYLSLSSFRMEKKKRKKRNCYRKCGSCQIALPGSLALIIRLNRGTTPALSSSSSPRKRKWGEEHL